MVLPGEIACKNIVSYLHAVFFTHNACVVDAVLSRPPSSFFDSVRDSYDNHDRLADDLTVSLSSALCSNNDLADTTFLVGKLYVCTVLSATDAQLHNSSSVYMAFQPLKGKGTVQIIIICTLQDIKTDIGGIMKLDCPREQT